VPPCHRLCHVTHKRFSGNLEGILDVLLLSASSNARTVVLSRTGTMILPSLPYYHTVHTTVPSVRVGFIAAGQTPPDGPDLTRWTPLDGRPQASRSDGQVVAVGEPVAAGFSLPTFGDPLRLELDQVLVAAKKTLIEAERIRLVSSRHTTKFGEYHHENRSRGEIACMKFTRIQSRVGYFLTRGWKASGTYRVDQTAE
jgi:hypothetical protein